MIKARCRAGDGTTVIVLGLSERNLTLLREGRPLVFEMSELGIGPGHMVIVWGETEKDIEAELSRSLALPVGAERAG
jgi:hypothetical protein